MSIWTELRKPLALDAHQWRVMVSGQGNGIPAIYLDSRYIMDHLDNCVGPEHWRTQVRELERPGNEVGVQEVKPVPCAVSMELGIYDPDTAMWIVREDVGTGTDAKSAATDALKRVAVQFGVGRYLYHMPDTWYPVEQRGKTYVFTKQAHQKIRHDLAVYIGDGSAPDPQADVVGKSEAFPLHQDFGMDNNPSPSRDEEWEALPEAEFVDRSGDDGLSTDAKKFLTVTRRATGDPASDKQKNYATGCIEQAAGIEHGGPEIVEFCWPQGLTKHQASEIIDKLRQQTKNRDTGEWEDNAKYSPMAVEVIREIAKHVGEKRSVPASPGEKRSVTASPRAGT